MPNKFILDLKSVFSSHNFTETLLADSSLFVYEDAQTKLTEMSNVIPPFRHFKINNPKSNNLIGHICIDGDFIPYGQEKYNAKSSNFSEGRPDSIVFDKNIFLFLELKLEQEDATWEKEDTKWKKFFEGVNQILDFVTFLRDNNFEVNDYYNVIYAIICMRFEPNFSILKSNSQRNNLRFKISSKLGFEIKAHNHIETFEF